jgi:hypothetical protein
MSDDFTDNLRTLLESLENPDPDIRINALKALSELEPSSPEIVRALERVVANDPNEGVKETALLALSEPRLRSIHQSLSSRPSSQRRIILPVVNELEIEGIISHQVASLLRSRYTLRPAPSPKPKERPPRAQTASLGQALLSETAVKLALYLGAFFVVSAAFIIAALVEVARLPILAITTLLFFGTAWGFAPRVRMASFVLFTIGTVMIPIDAGVLSDLLNLQGTDATIFWVFISALIGTIWAGGTISYRSRLFSVLAFISYDVTIVLIGTWFEAQSETILLLLGVVTVAGLATAPFLQKKLGKAFFWPIFTAANIQISVLLMISLTTLIAQGIIGESPSGSTWLAISATWLTATIAYGVSDSLTQDVHEKRLKLFFSFFRILAVISLTPVPLFAFGVVSPKNHQVMAIAWSWGLILAVFGEVITFQSLKRFKSYGPILQLSSLTLFAFSALWEWYHSDPIAIGYLAGAGVIFLALMVVKPRPLIWTASLGSFLLAYFAAFSLTNLQQVELNIGYRYLIPVVLLVVIDQGARRGFDAPKNWWVPPRLLGTILGGINLLIVLASGLSTPGDATVIFIIYGAVFALYSYLEASPPIAYGTTASLAIALVYALIHYRQDLWVPQFVVLSCSYYLIGVATTYFARAKPLSTVLISSGLALGVLTAFSAPVQGGSSSVVGVTIIALGFTVEAFRRRNVFLGFPANTLYFLAYVMVLVDLEVTEPQFYSIAAALLGITMHYLLLRANHQKPAFTTGILSQLVLLSTTYIQMIESNRFSFFFILFFQSLALLAYGIVIRSRSFVVMPIIFSILGVLGVAFSVLSGLPTALIIGCTGLLLLILGIVALLLRERLLHMTQALGERLGGWRA